jgi:hypothetical protein
MDNWKKYMSENDDNFSIEDVDDKVWQNVYKVAVPKRRSFFTAISNTLQAYGGKHRNFKFKFAYASVFAAFVIMSFAFKVKSHSKYGDMVSFEVAKKTYLLNNKTHSKNLFNTFSRLNSPSDSSSFLFIKCIKENNQEAKKIVHQLREEGGVLNLAVTPVVFEFRESLFSSFLNKAFDVQINKIKPDDKQIKSKIKDVLKEKGLSSVDIQVDDNSHDILFSSRLIDQEQLFKSAKDSVAITNNINGGVNGTSKTDTTKKPRVNLQQLEDPQWKKDLAVMTDLTTALEKDGLIDNKKPYKLEIRDGELYINGKKQTKKVNDKYRKYFKNDNYTITNDGDQQASTSDYNDAPKDKTKTGLPHFNNNLPIFDPVQYKKDLKLMNLLIKGLDEDGLIDMNKPYTVQIKEGELIINNKKQPIEVSDKFRKYFQSNNYGFVKE